GNPRLKLLDYAFLLRRHPLELACGEAVYRKPDIAWKDLYAATKGAQESASDWIFNTKHRKPQDLRLRIRIEEDAFNRMTPYWRRLGFPFATLTPSLATAIGNSSDRPSALAELMGIIANDGVRLPTHRFEEFRFGAGTPYHTVFRANEAKGQ